MNMKYKSFLHKSYCTFVLFLMFALSVDAQFKATWALTSNKTVAVTGVQATNVSALNMVPASNLSNPGTHNTNGYEVKPLAGYTVSSGNNYWQTTFNDSNAVILPISPNAGFDAIIDTFSITTRRSNSSGENTAMLSYRTNGAGSWNYIGTSKVITTSSSNTITTFAGLNTIFYTGASYEIKVHFAAETVLTTRDNRVLTIKNLTVIGRAVSPPFIVPVVTTGSLGTATKYSNTATNSFYTISNGGVNVRPVLQSGVIYSTNPTPIFSNSSKTVDIATNGTGTATFNSSFAGLTPATTYYVRAYALTQADTVYGGIVSFTTAPYTIPTISTTAPSNVLSTKATTGGNTIDSGGYAVSEKGICYSSSNNLPAYTGVSNSHTSDGSGNANFATILKNLTPSTKYYIRAYAKNQLGVGYGNLDSFTTGAPVPTITVTPATLDFGDITYNSSATVLSYKVNASNLNPSVGSITLNATNGYIICSTYNGTYNNTLTLTYAGSTITNKIIYVKNKTNSYGTLNGIVTHSGGGTVAPNADTVFLTTNVIQNADTLSNAGSDFWCGFGYQEKMKENTTQFDTTLSSKGSHLSLFIAAGNQGDSVIVELPGIPNAPTFPRRVYVPASGFIEIGGFPVGDGDAENPTNGPDTRLYYTGISKKGIHIYTKSGVPVSAWLYDWNTGDAAAGAMLFPTNTWNSSYVVQSVGGKANNSGYNNNSFFFVIAKDDNTVVTFKPTNDILDSNSATIFSNGHQHTPAYVKYKKDSTYTIILNKGEVFNAMGFVGDPAPASADPGALDLSGTVVSTTCDKKIAVFGGNGRCVLGTAGSNPTVGNANCNNPTSGSDNLIQQMFPKVAWGTVYLTVPTKNMANNLFRVYVQDINTDVKLNGTLLLKANLIKGLYYQFDINRPSKIESNIPVSVTQFIVSGACQHAPSGNIGKGDPEMITLSPVQQSITSTTVYSATFKNGNTPPNQGCSYINVVVKGFDGVSSFKFDGSTSGIDTGSNTFTGGLYAASVPANLTNVNAFKKHPYDTNYYYATFRVSSKAKHTLFSTQGFNAIAYGVSDGESYGYNAGTTINNLSAVNVSVNPAGTDTSSSSVKVVKYNQVYLQIAVPYDTTTINSISWDAQGNANVNPNTAQNGIINPNTSKPICLGTIVKDGRTFYIYQSPVQYIFNEDGAYKIKVTFSGTFVSDCGGTDVKYLNVIVGHDDISFDLTRAVDASGSNCTSLLIKIDDNSTGFANTTIKTWIWDFGDGSKKDTVQITDSWAPTPKINPHQYPSNTTYYLKLTTINTIGGVTTDSALVDLNLLTAPSFSISQDSTCPGNAVVFTPLTATGAAKWFWDYGDGSAVDSTTTQIPVSHSYTTEGIQTVSHWIKNSAGCPSSMTKDTVFVLHKPIANFISPSGVCLPGNTLFTNSSDTAIGLSSMPYTYRWDFGVLALTNDTSNIKDPIYQYTTAPGAGEYNVSLVATSKYGCASSAKTQLITNVYSKPTAVIASTTDKKICVGSFAQFNDSSYTNGAQNIQTVYWIYGDGSTNIGTAPLLNFAYAYNTASTFAVKHVAVTDKGCVSDTATWTIKVNPNPVAGTILPSSCITSGSLLFKDNSTVATDDSVQTPYTYTWNFGDGTGTFTTKDSTHTYSSIGTYYINHSITTLNGCTDTKTDTFTISGSKPVPRFRMAYNRISSQFNFHYCSKDTIKLIDSSTISIGTIKKVEIFWDRDDVYQAGLNANPTVDLNPQNGSGTITPKVYSFVYPSHYFNRSPVIYIKVYNDANCFAIDSIMTVRIFGLPVIKFDTIKGICVNGTPKLINLAYDSSHAFDNPLKLINGKPAYSGSGIYNDSMFNPSVAGVGTHNIKVLYELTVPVQLPVNTTSNPNHCRDSAYAPITVWALPQPAIQVSNPTCEKNKISFTDKTPVVANTGNISSWKWHFGEPASGANDSSALQNPDHTYSAYGTYNVTLTATSDSGCVGTTTPPVAVIVHPLPKVGFIPPNGTCAGSPVSFKDTSKIADGSEAQFTHFWNFGDPTSASNTAIGNPLVNATHLYNGSPTDSIKLIVTSKDGCIDSFAMKLSSTTIHPKPIANFVVNGTFRDTARGCSGNAIAFKDSSSVAAGTSYWVWGDNGTTVETGSPINHTFTSATTQTFIGSHYIDDIYGCRSDTIKVVSTAWGLPTVAIQVSNPTCEKNRITLTDKSTPSTGNGAISKWLWKFGEPTSGANDSSKIQNPNHTYNAYGSYNVFLTVTSDSGCVATNSTATIVTVHPLPKVGFSSPNGTCAGSPVTFTDTSKIADGSEAQFNYAWNFGDPTSTSNTKSGVGSATSSHSYNNPPTDSVRLVITSKDGCIDSMVTKLSSTIYPKQFVKFSANGKTYYANDTIRVCLGNAINFRNTNTPTVTQSSWDFGNPTGTVVTGSTQSYTYTNAQVYTGQHYALDNNNCNTDTVNFKVQIWALPTVAFDTALIKCEKANIAFVDRSVAGAGSGNINAWTWHFGHAGNDSSKLQNPLHAYNNAGVYNVSLKVTTDSGCSATLTPAKAIVINPKPRANFIMQDTTCLPLATTFTSSSTIADGSESQFLYLWNFGDFASGLNNVSILNPASHNYPSSANYNVQLIVTSKNGCMDTTRNKVLNASSIHNQPNALYTVNTASHDTPRVCLGVPVNFKDASSNVQTSYWIWGDNGLTVELGVNPSPQFATTPAGIYYGQHYIDDNFGCRSSITPIVTIIDALPTVKGETKYVMKNTPNMLMPTITNATSFSWTVTKPLGLADDYLDFNDVENPICTPLTDVTYLITVSNDGGCIDTASYYVKLLKTPEIPTAFSPNGDGINDTWNIGYLSEYVGATVQVFNRYGQIVLNKFGYGNAWNGKINNNGADLPIGVYYYIIKPGSGMPVMTGYVTILR